MDLLREFGHHGLPSRSFRGRDPGIIEAIRVDPEDRQVRGEIRYGGYNHSVGLATHDAMGMFDGPDEVLKPGFVFACDIQVILPEEEIGIRLEDTIAITSDGYINLSAGLPRTIAEIEALMRKEGIIQILKKQELY